MSEPEPPALRILWGGKPADDELAALVVVLTARAAEGLAEQSLRQPLSPWVASGLAKGTRTKA
jgi:hypothetical protein